MSMSTQHGGEKRRPSVVSTGSPGKKAAAAESKSTDAKTTDAKATDAKPTDTKPTGAKPTNTSSATTKSAAKKTPAKKAAAGKGGGPRRPVTPVKVDQGRNWGPIALFAAVILLAGGIIGYGGWYVYKGTQSYKDKAAAIDGIIDWAKRDAKSVEAGHQDTPVQYTVTPPVGGKHNTAWQRCLGDVYDAPIANEHAVHSLEHGAIWITYRPDLPADQVEKLAKRVRGNDYMLMSPVDGLDKPITLQAWGYQLKVDNADDKRIDQFVSALLGEAGPEKGATCSSGNFVTATGTQPRDMSQQQGG